MKTTDIIKTYSELNVGDIIYWYGALVRIIEITHETRKLNGVEKECTYFSIEPFNNDSLKILGDFYAHGTYGGINELTVLLYESEVK